MKLQKYIIPVILITVAVAIALYLLFPKATNNIDTGNMAEQGAADVAQASSITKQNKMAVAQASPRGPYVLVAEVDGQSAFDLLDKYTAVGYKEYDFGALIESINGLAGDKQNFWAFYVNGEFASKGISQTILNAGDSIELIYEQAETYKNL